MTEKIYVPPIKIQGIKTKLVPIIKGNVSFSPSGKWIEPFMGSGVVGFNVAPEHALFSDMNPFIIDFYKAIQDGRINSILAREYLEYEGALLKSRDADHYYEVRKRFNETHEPLDFLFLNRSCFNGMIRFNKKHEFNVPYNHKPDRFAKAYVTKIVNQIKWVETIIANNDWHFEVSSFESCISKATSDDFIYCDPPYIGRHVDYYDSWDENNENDLKEALVSSGAKFMLSTWEENRYRRNEFVDTVWADFRRINQEHFYFIGAKETNRNSMKEALIMNY